MKTTIKVMAIALITAMAFTGCKKEYTIVVESNNPAWGTVSGGGTYADGADATISATPFEGFYFISWQDGDRSNPRVVHVTASATYTAVFSADPNGGGQGGDGDPMQMSGSISENVTWADRGLPVDYIVDGMISIEGNALLTVAPGVTIMFTGVNGGIFVGENAGLRMVGTADKPIVLQGPTNNPNNGSWQEVRITSNRSDNQFEYVQFLRGGSGDAPWDAVVHINGRLGMKHCIVDGSLCNGVSCENEGYLSAFENNTVRNCSKYPLYYETLLAPCKGLGTGNTFIGNTGGDVVFMAGTGVDMATENLTMPNAGYPYRMNGSMSVTGSRTFTIEAGTVIELPANNEVYVSDATFVANGTASSPIVFRCSENGEHWNGINFFSNKNGNSITYCQIMDCGTNDGYGENDCLYIRGGAKLTLSNNTFGPSAYYGIALEYVEVMENVTHSNNNYTNCAAGNVYIEVGGTYNGIEYEDGQVLNDLP